MKRAPLPFKIGDRVEVEWEDIQINATGDSKDAATATRSTMGYYKGLKTKKLLVIMTHKDDEPGSEGWTAIPLGNVLSITGVALTEARWGNEMGKGSGSAHRSRGSKGASGVTPGGPGSIDGSIDLGHVAQGGK